MLLASAVKSILRWSACIILLWSLRPALAVDGQMVIITANPGKIMDGTKVLAEVPRSTRLWVLEEKEGWLKVNDPKSDQRGWISDQAVQEVTFTNAQQKQLEQAAKHYSDYEQQQLKDDQLTKARQNIEAGLQLERGVYGVHPEVAVTLSDLSYLLGKFGEHAAAQKAGEEALALYRQFLGAKHVETARMAAQLGEQFLETGDHVAARRLLNEALPVLREEIPREADTALVLNALGNLELTTAKYTETRTHFEAALAILRETTEDRDENNGLID